MAHVSFLDPGAFEQWVYAPSLMDSMSGYLGNVMLVNGTPDAWLSVDRGLYRFRLLNASNARICRVALSDGTRVNLSRPESAPGWRLEFSTAADGGAWAPVRESPTLAGGRWTVTLTELTRQEFYRLVQR